MAENIDSPERPEELIPDSDTLLRPIPSSYVQGDSFAPMAFRLDQEPRDGRAFSVDWGRYTTPEESRDRRPCPASVGVVRLSVAAVRAIRPLAVAHRPIEGNLSHSHVLAPRDTDRPARAELRNRLHEIAVWVLRPSEPARR